jgi:hypothetical protein
MNANARFLNEAKELETRWSKTGILKGIEDPYVRSATAVLLENQRLINEVATDTSDVAQFKRISIPLVRRIYPQLIANKIVSVQPLLGPTGLVYYLRFRYSSNKGYMQGASNDSGFPADDNTSLQQRASGDANLDIYYSSQFVQNEKTPDTIAVPNSAVNMGNFQHTPILDNTVTGTIYLNGTVSQTFTVASSGAFTFNTVSGTDLATSGSLDLNTGGFSLSWNATASGPVY